MEPLLKVRLKIEDTAESDGRYRLYLNDYLLVERFYPVSIGKDLQLEENVFLKVNADEYTLKLENLTRNTVYISDVSINHMLFRNINSFNHSFVLR